MINRCLGGIRMEDQGERIPQTFLVNNFSFPQPRRKQGDRCAFKRVLNTDRGLKQLPGLKKIKMVIYILVGS